MLPVSMAKTNFPFRVLILAYDYRPKLGGVASATFELAKALSQKESVEVSVLAPCSRGFGNAAQRDRDFDAHSYFSTKRVRIPRNDFLAVGALAVHLFWRSLRWRPQVVISSLWLPCGVAAWLARPGLSLLGIKVFNTVHGVEICESDRTPRKRLRSRLKWVKDRVMSRSEKIFSVSQFTASYLLAECRLPIDQVKVIYNGVDPSIFFPKPPSLRLRQQYQLENRTTFLTLSRLEDYKGVDYVLAALSQVAIQNTHWKYLIGGEGPDRAHLEKLVVQYGLEKQVQFLGAVPPEQLNELYNLSDVFVLNSRDDWTTPNFEGFGIVLIEAAACAKPSLAGRSGGIPEVVEDGKTGWLVSPEDAGGIAERLLQILADPIAVRRCGQAAYVQTMSRFQWSQVAETVLRELNYVRN